MTYKSFLLSALCLSACAKSVSPQEAFFDNLTALCGQSFAGKMVSTDEVDRDFASKAMRISVTDCSNTEVRIPFAVGEDTSRTWVISKTADGLRLKHDHRHKDGSEDDVSQYGGDTADAGTAYRQEFPVDQYSIDLFNREGLTASVVNIWAVEVKPGDIYAYELMRPNRFFRVEFDLKNPI